MVELDRLCSHNIFIRACICIYVCIRCCDKAMPMSLFYLVEEGKLVLQSPCF